MVRRSPWLPPPNPRADVRLFCFPAAGYGASQYREWSAAFGREIDVCPIQLPGREQRINEPPVENLLGLASQVADNIHPFCDRPYALFGHSLGALLAFEVARRLRERARGALVGFFPAAHPAPHLPCRSEPEFERVRIPADLDEELAAELTELVRPALEADVRMRLNYEFRQSSRLVCPVVVLGATDNPEITPADLSSWRHHTWGDFRQVTIRGDHFFVHDARSEVAAIIQKELGLPPKTSEARPRPHVAHDS